MAVGDGATFRFIVEDALSGGSSGQGNSGGNDNKPENNPKPDPPKPPKSSKPNKELSDSVKGGITSAFKTLGIQVSLANLLKQSQVFTGIVSSIFQVLGAVLDVALAPLLPFLAKFLKNNFPKLLEYSERIANFLSGELAKVEELGIAAYFSTVIKDVAQELADAFIEILPNWVRKALGLKTSDEREESNDSSGSNGSSSLAQKAVNALDKVSEGPSAAYAVVAQEGIKGTAAGVKRLETLTARGLSKIDEGVSKVRIEAVKSASAMFNKIPSPVGAVTRRLPIIPPQVSSAFKGAADSVKSFSKGIGLFTRVTLEKAGDGVKSFGKGVGKVASFTGNFAQGALNLAKSPLRSPIKFSTGLQSPIRPEFFETLGKIGKNPITKFGGKLLKKVAVPAGIGLDAFEVGRVVQEHGWNKGLQLLGIKGVSYGVGAGAGVLSAPFIGPGAIVAGAVTGGLTEEFLRNITGFDASLEVKIDSGGPSESMATVTNDKQKNYASATLNTDTSMYTGGM